jgi:hypothetical protein
MAKQCVIELWQLNQLTNTAPPPLSRQNEKLMLVMQNLIQLKKDVSFISSLRLFVLGKIRHLTNHSCLERCRIIPPNITATVSTELDLSSNQSACLAIGCETFFFQMRKLSDKLVVKLVVFGVNDVNPTCTSFSVSKPVTFCFVTPSTDVFGQRKTKRFAVSLYNIIHCLKKLSPPLNVLSLF